MARFCKYKMYLSVSTVQHALESATLLRSSGDLLVGGGADGVSRTRRCAQDVVGSPYPRLLNGGRVQQ